MGKDEKSMNGGAKKRKLLPNMETEQWLRCGKKRPDNIGKRETLKMNLHVGESAKIDIGKGKKRKSSIMEEVPSKRRLRSDSRKCLDETGSKENGELPNFDLPSELLVKIIDMIPTSQWASLESVSHQFQGVVHELWGRLREIRLGELSYNIEKKKANPYPVAEAVLEKILKRAPMVASISDFAEFFHQHKLIRLKTVQLLSKFQHLESIEFSGREMITANNFAVFLESSESRQCWKSLDIDDGIYVTNNDLKALGSKNQPALNLNYFKFDLETLRKAVFDRCLQVNWSRLKKLVLFHSSVSTAKEVLSILRQCTQVAHLEITVTKCGYGNDQPSFGNFMQGVADLKNLSVLKIKGNSLLDSAAFKDALLVLIQNLAHRGITDLALMACYCTDRIIDAVIDYLPRLKSLELDVEETASILRLANTMGQLQSLKLQFRWPSKIHSTVIRAIVDNMSNLQCLHLVYPGCNVEDFTILGHLRKLNELRITGTITSRGLISKTIETWTRMGFGSRLETLELDLIGVSPEVMGGFLKNLPRLRSLKLYGIDLDKGNLEPIAISCPKVVSVLLSFWESPITYTDVQFMIDHCSQLKMLKIPYPGKWFPSALTVGKYRKITFNY